MKQSLRYAVLFTILVTASLLSCKKEYSYEKRNGNRPPIADAGVDQQVLLPMDSTMLDGSASTDLDGSISSFQWRKIAGPAATLRSANSQTTMVNSLTRGTFQFQLTVTDNSGVSALDTVSIIVNDVAANRPPVAIAFWDSLNNQPPGSKLVTAKYSTDPDGVIVSYKWTKIGGPSTFTIVDPLAFETVIANLVQGSYAFELIVTDNGGLTGRDTVLVNVGAPANTRIIANAGPDQTITLPLDSTYLDGSRSMPNGFSAPANIIFRWTAIAGPTQYVLNAPPRLSPELTKTTAVAGRLLPGVYLFTFTITEPGFGSVTDTIQVTVLDDPQNRNTLTYHQLIWEKSNTSQISWQTTFLSTPLRPDLWDPAGVHRRNLEFWVRSNQQAPWTSVPFITNRNTYFWYGLPYTGLILTNPDNPSLVGTKSDMRIKIL